MPLKLHINVLSVKQVLKLRTETHGYNPGMNKGRRISGSRPACAI